VRIIFFAGKGGTGKTSIAAATGVRAAEMGKKTVIMSLDVAHSLSDIFDRKKKLFDQNSGQPRKIRPNLYIQEIDIQEEIKRYWGDIHRYLSSLFNTTGLDAVLAEELAILPGMEEVSLLLYINKYVREKEFDVILLDCAPTGESLRFISIPTTLEWYMKKIFKLERTIARYVRPVAKRIYDVPLPDDDYFKAVENLFERLNGVDQILTNPERTTVRLITNPEKIVIKETQRAFMYFCLYKMNIDAIIMNRILPGQIKEPYFKTWIKDQRKYYAAAENIFSPVPILSVHLFEGEILGYSKLKKLAKEIYGPKDPLQRFYKEAPYQLFKDNHNYHLKLKLPFLSKKDVELNKYSDELIVRIGGFKRNILLPRQVASMEQVTAKLDGQVLDICFEGAEHGSQKR
jgi:arsenite-transporting ATPase